MVAMEYAFYVHAAVFLLVFAIGIPILLGLMLRAAYRVWRRHHAGAKTGSA